ncbi:MAG: HAD-IIB family hydrolase [Candidatus Stygibacter frigidus]|nr:HAD-IIB family hydrolase [Candidatus Stygibacter frigidus]
MKKLDLVIMDLDGSLLNSQSMISEKDQNTLKKLGDKGVIRAIATGRNYYSAQLVLKNNPEIDYAIISTGLGIINYHTGECLLESFLERKDVIFLTELLLKEKVDFMIHDTLPDNHYVTCHDAKAEHPDFHLRWGWYREFASNLDMDLSHLQDASQFVVFFPHNTPRIAQLRLLLPQFKIIRTTSPITRHYDWMEIFPCNVSKGHALQWLCDKHHIDIKNTLCLGNDYNDLDMLRLAGKSYVVENVAKDLKKEFRVTVSNDRDPLTEIVRDYDI